LGSLDSLGLTQIALGGRADGGTGTGRTGGESARKGGEACQEKGYESLG